MKIKKDIFETEEAASSSVRINKFLADSGVCSRREADKAVEQGKVTIDGEIAVMGSKVLPGQTVTYMGKVIEKDNELVLIAFNKPVGIECTTDTRVKDNVIDYINYGKRIFPIGRLDKDSEGLLLLTNDGNIINKILRAGNYHEKEYIVKVNKDITPEFLKAMGNGVPILDTVTRPCKIEQVDRFTFRIILTQGLNRQIRRMCEALNYRVLALTRIRIMNINLGRLKSGCIRNVTPAELETLRELIEESSNAPIDYNNTDNKRSAIDIRAISEGETDSDTIEESVISLKAQAKSKWEARKKSLFNPGVSDETSVKTDIKFSDNNSYKANKRESDRDSYKTGNSKSNRDSCKTGSRNSDRDSYNIGSRNSDKNSYKSGSRNSDKNSEITYKDNTEKSSDKKSEKSYGAKKYDKRTKNSTGNRIDKSSFGSSKSLRTGRPRDNQ